MKLIILILSAIFFFSCELHKQEVRTPPPVEAKVIDLDSIETLIAAVLQDDYFTAKRTLELTSLELNVINEQGKLLLNEAIKLDRLLMGELLISYGALPDESDEFNETARELIQKSAYIDEWKTIFDGGSVSSDYVTKESFILLSETAIDNQDARIHTMGLYRERGADINSINSDNQSLLMIASSKNLVKVVDYLCSFEELDPNLTVTVIRRRREFHITAMFYAQTPEMKSALRNCGVTE